MNQKQAEKGMFIHHIEDEKDQYHRTVNLTSLLDKNLSFKAKGLHNYMTTRPYGWKLWTSALFSISTDGETSVRSAINELIANKYLYRTPIRKQNRITQWIYVVFSIPTQINKEEAEKLVLGNLKIGGIEIENQVHSNKIYSNKNNSRKNISKDISVSNETPKNNNLQKREPIQKENHKRSSYVERWNSFQATPKHKNPSSKVYQKGAQYLSQLAQGIFWGDKTIDKEWWNKNKISKEWLSKKWKPAELLKGLENLSKLFIEGYWPPDKSKLPRSLPDLMYNSRTNHSFLFLILKNPPQPLRKNNIPKDNHPGLTGMITKEFDIEISHQLINNLSTIVDFNENDIINSGNYVRKVRNKYPKENAQSLLKDYIHWLGLQDWIEDVNASAFNPDGKLFQTFVDYASENYIGVHITKGTLLWG